MTETQRRIKAYQALLPELRERVVAVALLLAMSASMLSSASFAWLTISRSPEVTAVNTTVAANGNLEIALVTGEEDNITPPGDSKVGDSSATKGQSVTAANITWGNLVNLADPSYGLEKMVLRPALLNESALSDRPLWGAAYGEDGRTAELDSDFAYATWEPADEATGRDEGFAISDKLGVRAITSVVESESSEYQKLYKNRMKAAENANTAAGDKFQRIIDNKTLMDSLAAVMGTYMTDILNDSNSTLDNAHVASLGTIFEEFIGVYELQIDAMVKLANFQLYALNGGVTENYTELTREDLMAESQKTLKSKYGIEMEGFDQMKTDYNMLNTYYSGEPKNSSGAAIENMSSVVARSKLNESIYYSDIEYIVAALVNVSTCELVVGSKTYVVGKDLGVSNAISILTNQDDKYAVITNGVLKNFEQLNGREVHIEGMSIHASYSVFSADIEADIYTTAAAPYQFTKGINYAETKKKPGQSKTYSQDTYGLAIDLWVRTNAANSHLILEGNVLTEAEEVHPTVTVDETTYTVEQNGQTVTIYPIVGEDGTQTWYNASNGEPMGDLTGQTINRKDKSVEYDLYTITYTQENEGGETSEYSMDLYKKEAADGTVTWYNAKTHTALAEEDLEGKTPVQKVEIVETVIGYEGENRVWNQDSDSMISADATTQGSGSCYVYYADTPEDQARSLELLKSFKVAFVDDHGTLLAKASMDTERAYATSGRVIVPLKLDADRSIVLEDETNGELTYAITELEKNVATRITALVYLDGTELYNENVLAAADIQGRLNIQFGSTMIMEPMRNTELENKTRTVSAKLSRDSFDYDVLTDDLTTRVEITVTGDEPSNVTAFFLREINSTQGSREETITFTYDTAQSKNGISVWFADYTFPAPGKYVLRSVQLDGVEYDLPLTDGQPLRAEVKGFAVEMLDCEEGKHLSLMTDQSSKTVNLTLKFATTEEDKLPKTVQGRYVRGDGTTVNVNFTRAEGQLTWRGSGTFTASGDYTMQYLILDGDYTELEPGMWLTADLTMGMRVAVTTTTLNEFLYKPGDASMPTELEMQVQILDGEGTKLKNQSGAELFYSMAGDADIAHGMYTPLTWNSNGYYTGTFNTKMGKFSFAYVKVGENTLYNATAAPVFTIMSPEAPKFVADKSTDQTVLGTYNATMGVEIANTEAATASALLTWNLNDTTKEFLVKNTETDKERVKLNNTGVWQIKIPRIANEIEASDGSQNGYWTIKEIHLANVYKGGTLYTEAEPLVISGEDAEVKNSGGFKKVKVVSDATIELTADNWNANLGQVDGVTTGTFLQEYTISDITMKASDFAGEPLIAADSGISVRLEYKHGNDSADYGGYTTTNTVMKSVYLNQTEDSTRFEMADDITVNQAGTYTPSITFEKDNQVLSGYTVSQTQLNKIKFAVWSVTPGVAITAISPTSVSNIDTSSGDGHITPSTQPSFTANTATVYFSCSRAGEGSTCNPYRHNYSRPSVTITLSNKGNADSAELNFGDDKEIYNGSTQVTGYSWTENGALSRNIGYYKNNTASSDSKTPAGTLTTTQLILKKGSIQYTVPVSITINNPY